MVGVAGDEPGVGTGATACGAPGAARSPRTLAPHFPDDEVGQLAEALDDYAARLTEVVQRDREFNADVSHELRTPLAVIRGAAELLLSQPGRRREDPRSACTASSAPSSSAPT